MICDELLWFGLGFLVGGITGILVLVSRIAYLFRGGKDE